MDKHLMPGTNSPRESLLNRRGFMLRAGAAVAVGSMSAFAGAGANARPNLIFVFADQWRAQAAGYAGDKNAHTPNIDRLAAESVNVANMVSVCPVCTPYRASLQTGRYPLSTGMIVNDMPLPNGAITIAEVLQKAGYRTGYIGKWHLDGRGRAAFTPPERRKGFEYWKTLECTHDYNKSLYYEGSDPSRKFWQGYDAIAQTHDAIAHIAARAREGQPFCLFLSWGSPHSPYNTAPEKYRKMFESREIELRPNVPDQAREATLTKLLPWDESACVPFLLHFPAAHGNKGRIVDTPMTTPDIMPTLLGLCGVDIPKTVEGTNFAATIRGDRNAPDNDAVLFLIPAPFAVPKGIREWRAIRTRRYTYAENIAGPWLLFDNQRDPYQCDNLCGKPEHQSLQDSMWAILQRKLADTHDEFRDARYYKEKWKIGKQVPKE